MEFLGFFLTNLLRATCRLRSLHWAWYSSSCFEGTKGNRTCLRMSKTNLLRLPTSCSSQESAAWNTWYSESTRRSSEGSRFRSSSLGRSENSSSVLTCKNFKNIIYKVRMPKINHLRLPTPSSSLERATRNVWYSESTCHHRRAGLEVAL